MTQQEIADVVGLSRQGVGENAKKLSTKVSGIRHLYHDEQKSVDEIAEVAEILAMSETDNTNNSGVPL